MVVVGAKARNMAKCEAHSAGNGYKERENQPEQNCDLLFDDCWNDASHHSARLKNFRPERHCHTLIDRCRH